MRRWLFSVVAAVGIFGLSETAYASGVYTFLHDSCSDQEEWALAVAEGAIPVMIEQGLIYSYGMTGIQTDTYNYFFWFGGWIDTFVKIFKFDLASMQQRLTTSTVYVSCHSNYYVCDGKTLAWTWTNYAGPPLIYLCDLFWEDIPETTAVGFPNGRSNVMIHELAHSILSAQDLVTSLWESRLMVLSGTYLNPAPWQAALFCAFNYEGYYATTYFSYYQIRGGCSTTGLGHGPIRPENGRGMILLVSLLILGVIWRKGKWMRRVQAGGAFALFFSLSSMSVAHASDDTTYAKPTSIEGLGCTLSKRDTSVSVTITNKSSQPIQFIRWSSFWDPVGPPSLIVWNRNGERMKVRPGTLMRTRARSKATKEDFISLVYAKEVVSPWVDLTAWWDDMDQIAKMDYWFVAESKSAKEIVHCVWEEGAHESVR